MAHSKALNKSQVSKLVVNAREQFKEHYRLEAKDHPCNGLKHYYILVHVIFGIYVLFQLVQPVSLQG